MTRVGHQAPTGILRARPASGGGPTSNQTKPRPRRTKPRPAHVTPSARRRERRPRTSSIQTPSRTLTGTPSLSYTVAGLPRPYSRALEVYSMAHAMWATRAIPLVLLLSSLAQPGWLQARLWVLIRTPNSAQMQSHALLQPLPTAQHTECTRHSNGHDSCHGL